MRSTTLSTLLVPLAAALSARAAFTSTLGAAAQCQDLNVAWSGDAGALGPPFSITLLPFKSVPIVVNIPDSAFNASSNSGVFTISQLPLPAYTKFVAVMDDGFGRGTGGVSSILTVGGSSTSACLGGASTTPPGLITLSGTPQQCSTLSIGLSSSLSSPVTIRGVIPSGSAFSLDSPAAGATSSDWTVNVAAGTQIVLFVSGGGSGQMETTDLLTVGGNPSGDASCIGGAGPSSTGSGSGDTTAPVASGTTAPVTTPSTNPATTTSASTTGTGTATSLTRTGLTVTGGTGTTASTKTLTTALPTTSTPSGANARTFVNLAAAAGLPVILSILLA